MGFQIGERVWIRIPFQARIKQGVIYNICAGRRWPYHVMPDDADYGGVAYTEAELAPASLPHEQVVPTSIPEEDYALFASVMGKENNQL